MAITKYFEPVAYWNDDPKVEDEIHDAFDSVGTLVRAKANRLCNNMEHDKAQELLDAWNLIIHQDYMK